MDPQRQGRTSGSSRILLVLQIRKVSCAPSLTVFLSPISVLTSSSVSFLSRFCSRFCYMETFIYVGFAHGSESVVSRFLSWILFMGSLEFDDASSKFEQSFLCVLFLKRDGGCQV